MGIACRCRFILGPGAKRAVVPRAVSPLPEVAEPGDGRAGRRLNREVVGSPRETDVPGAGLYLVVMIWFSERP